GLMEAGAQAGTSLAYVLIAGSVVTSLLTLYAMSRVWGRAFWRAPTAVVAGPGRGALGAGVVAPTAALVAVGIGITVVAGPLFGITDRAAADLLHRTPYVEAVFPGGAPP